MSVKDPLKYAFEDVRRLDPERYKLASLAPKAEREGLLVLLAFNLEVARIPEMVGDPTLGLIRLQWWRDTLESLFQGTGRDLGHPVAELLRRTITKFDLSQSIFATLLDARSLDMAEEPIPNVEAFEAYAMGTSGTLDRAFMDVLGQQDEDQIAAAQHMGAAWAMTGLIRALPFHAKTGRLYIPSSMLSNRGLSRDALLALNHQSDLSPVLEDVCSLIEAHLSETKHILGPRFSKTAAPVFLKGGMVRQYLKHLRGHNFALLSIEVSTWQASPWRLLMGALVKVT